MLPVKNDVTLLRTHNVSVKLGGNSILENIDLQINRGEIVTIVGPNGSGKSTLLRLFIGAIAPSTGTVEHSSRTVIGYVPQRLHVDDTFPMTVHRFLCLPRRRSQEEIKAALEQAGLTGFGRHQLNTLSGGQFQRVLLTRAMLEKPDLLLLDEATQGLDHEGSADFYRQIEQVRQKTGCAIVMVSHELHVVMKTSDRVICLNHHICCQGTPDIVQAAPGYRSLFGLDDKDVFATYHHHHPMPTQRDAV